jgi:hypothetical protein
MNQIARLFLQYYTGIDTGIRSIGNHPDDVEPPIVDEHYE